MLERANLLSKAYLGFSLGWVVAVIVLLSSLGGLAGMFFPQTAAYAMLQFSPFKMKDKTSAMDLQMYKRIEGSYGSKAVLKAFLDGAGDSESPPARRLLRIASNPDFWSDAITPVLSFSRADQRRFGDMKEAVSGALVGLELRTNASSEADAEKMLLLLSDYAASAWMREELRAWVLNNKAYVATRQSTIQTEILRAQFDIQMSERRVEDMKALLTRYPDSGRIDPPRVAGGMAVEGAERFLSPITQLVGAESTISARRETILRLQREASQLALLPEFYAAAEKLVEGHLDASKLIAELSKLWSASFPTSATSDDGVVEAALAVRADIESFAEAKRQTGVRTQVQLLPSAARDPQRLATIGALLGLGLLLALGVFNSMSRRLAASS